MQQGNQTSADELNFDEFKAATYDEWKEAAIAALKGAPFDKVMFTKLVDGVTLNPIYNKEDVPANIELPGQFPYRRSTRALGYAERPWDVAQTVYSKCPKGFNTKALNELAKGSTALTVNLSCKEGTKLKKLESWKTAFEGIDLSALNVYFKAGSCGLGQLTMLIETCKAQGNNPADLKGGMLYDPISVMLTKGKLCGGMGLCASMKQMATMTKWAVKNTTTEFCTIGVNGTTFANAGASAMDEVAFMLASATAYLRAMVDAGLSVDEVAPRIRFNAGINSNLFLEVCKLRALRMLWAQVVKACGGSDEAAKIKLGATTSRWSVSKIDPWVNMLRGTSQAFSAVLGGVDSLDVEPFDVAVRQPDEFSAHIARNIQLMLAGEFCLDKVVDPAGGSYYIESFTETLAKQAYATFQAIEAEGGMVEAIKAGTVQAKVADICGKRLQMVDQRRQTIVGCNKYVNLEEEALEVPEEEVKSCCAAKKAEGKKCCSEEAPLTLECDCPSVIAEAAAAGAKDCKIQKALVALYGCDCGVTEVTPLEVHHMSERFEALLDKAIAYKAANGERPKVHLATCGPLRQHKPRADFSQDFVLVYAT
ncbi:MAG: acyl-CoA mutase large subunit family protein, partial [Akkermansia sp.]